MQLNKQKYFLCKYSNKNRNRTNVGTNKNIFCMSIPMRINDISSLYTIDLKNSTRKSIQAFVDVRKNCQKS